MICDDIDEKEHDKEETMTYDQEKLNMIEKKIQIIKRNKY